MDYTVELETYRGPMDLLLYLVKQNEVDITDIPIARIAEQFLAYLEVLQTIDMQQAGDFLVMAATLMEIKSRMLLPRAPTAEGQDEDPRQELVKQLLEYKKFKEAATLLEEQARRQMSRMPRTPADSGFRVDPAHQPLRKVELWDLVSAFSRLMRETAALQPGQITVDETPIHVYAEGILAHLQGVGRANFRDVFTPPHHRGRLLGIFLAILELIKGGKIRVEQESPFAEIEITLAPPRTAEEEAAMAQMESSAAATSEVPPSDSQPSDAPASSSVE